ncbi:MAG: hypothetical protein QOH70_1870 [Blastocatellia bacterium]|jgi:hypothetical protein|nr:hypothetical protein [Blastocatellia bacterium]
MPIGPKYLISNSSELLHRNVHPQFILDNRITSQAFLLKNDDYGKLSVQQNSMASAEVAYERYTSRGFESGGVWSITIAECDELGLRVHSDPIDEDDSHSIVDLTAYSKTQARKYTDKLSRRAQDRGCQYCPAD